MGFALISRPAALVLFTMTTIAAAAFSAEIGQKEFLDVFADDAGRLQSLSSISPNAIMDIGGWLRSLGLERYEAAFRENAINEKVLPSLTAEDLKDMGVTIVGHRRMLLDAIAALRTDPSDHNAFFESSLGTNGQACVTCHQANQGISLNVANINNAFVASLGRDPLFRLSDTADRADADISTLQARRKAYRLFLDLGVVRIGKTFKGNSDPDNPGATQSDFRVEHQNTPEFGPLTSLNDPQHPGIPSLALFRRPLVNTNVSFDSAVLWDGRDRIDTLPNSQVPKAVQSLLLGSGSDTKANQQIADFMTGTVTDQIFDRYAGDLSAQGATGGVQSLSKMASDPHRPCLYATAFPQIPGLPQPGKPTLTPFSPTTCTRIDDNDPHTFGFDLFSAWSNLPRGGDPGINSARAAIARGEILFNTVVLHQPADLDGKLLDVGSSANGGANADHPDRIAAGQPIHCVTCHATHNLGNNPNPNFIGRIGTDSIDILKGLLATRKTQDPLVENVLRNVKKLPLYCLRPNSDPASFSSAPCGTHPGDVKTTDPGRAMVTGLIADVGKFKPPILRNLAARLPLFHAGTASNIFELIDFYDARFQINLTRQQKTDLAKFLLAM
jgi:cytochrome c peroxidase